MSFTLIYFMCGIAHRFLLGASLFQRQAGISGDSAARDLTHRCCTGLGVAIHGGPRYPDREALVFPTPRSLLPAQPLAPLACGACKCSAGRVDSPSLRVAGPPEHARFSPSALSRGSSSGYSAAVALRHMPPTPSPLGCLPMKKRVPGRRPLQAPQGSHTHSHA